jgi:hypothetical protein
MKCKIFCGDCFYYEIEKKDIPDVRRGTTEEITMYSCHRYPERYSPLPSYWCGEGIPRDDKNT